MPATPDILRNPLPCNSPSSAGILTTARGIFRENSENSSHLHSIYNPRLAPPPPPLMLELSRPHEEHSANIPKHETTCTRYVTDALVDDLLLVQELSMTGAAMGIMTVVGHATDSLVNAVGLASLLYARRKVTSSRIGKQKIDLVVVHGNMK